MNIQDTKRIAEILKGVPFLSTWGIAAQLKVSTSNALRKLKKLEAQGLVNRNKQYSAVNNIVWEAVYGNGGE